MPGDRGRVTHTALVTGASSGIGEALARRFARAGCNVVLVARSEKRLRALAGELTAEHGVKAWAVATDLTRRDAALRLSSAMRRARRMIDILVNDAGILEVGRFVDHAAGHHQRLIDLNVSALTAMLARFLPPMIERGWGRVLNVASLAAFQPVPSLATYAATKAYVLSLTESLSEELKGTGVSISALCPGITGTPMLGAAGRANRRLAKLPRLVVGDVEAVADEGFEACMNGDVVRVPGALNFATALAGRAAPRWLVRHISGNMARSLD